jgi:glucokinase
MLPLLVTGLPASGKSTLAGLLSEKLSIPLVLRDSFKEMSADCCPGMDRASLGLLSTRLMMSLLCQGRPLVAEAWIAPEFQGDIREELQDVRLIEVFCSVPWEVAAARYVERAASGRHVVHRAATEEVLCQLQAWRTLEPIDPARAIVIDTTDPVEGASLSGLVSRIQRGLQCECFGGSSPSRVSPGSESAGLEE